MSNVTTEQLAQLLLGIARTQQAVIEALENSKAGFKATHFRPALETASRIRSNRPETLSDLPARLLLQMMGRPGADLDQLVKDLEGLFAEPAANAAAPADEASPYAPAADAGSLEITPPG